MPKWGMRDLMNKALMAREAASYWADNASVQVGYPALEEDCECDVVIVGGGYTGLSSAYHLAKAGVSSIVLEAKTIGFGASGRNGGFVSSRFRYPLTAMARAHGAEAAKRMYEIGQDAAQTVERLVDELGIVEAGFKRTGSISGAHDARSLASLETMVEQVRALTGDQHWYLLSKEEIAEHTGSDNFCGGAVNGSIGALHPLNYVRGLARGCTKFGVRIYENTPALQIDEHVSGVEIRTERGLIRASQAILAANGYADAYQATKAVRRKVIPFQSVAIATAPIRPDLNKQVLGDQFPIMVETKRLPKWFHLVGDRLLVGGRGDYSGRENVAIYQQLRTSMLQIFPQLEGIKIDYRWSGTLAVTEDRLPHIGKASPRVYYAMGYNGTGVAMSSHMGVFLSKLVRSEPVDLSLLGSRQDNDIPFYFLRGLATHVVGRYYQVLDRLGK